MSKIVVGYDGSDPGKVALDRCLELAKATGDGIVIVFGYAPPGIWGGEIADHELAIEEIGEKVMGEAVERVKAAGVSHEVAMIPRRPADALIEVADKHDARLIVVGSQGETPLREMILGSTPHKLLHASKRPVLVVPATG
jgi:nucleotide-binding universal stress UspA family protein